MGQPGNFPVSRLAGLPLDLSSCAEVFKQAILKATKRWLHKDLEQKLRHRMQFSDIWYTFFLHQLTYFSSRRQAVIVGITCKNVLIKGLKVGLKSHLMTYLLLMTFWPMGSKHCKKWQKCVNHKGNYVTIYQPLRSGRIWHKVNF